VDVAAGSQAKPPQTICFVGTNQSSRSVPSSREAWVVTKARSLASPSKLKKRPPTCIDRIGQRPWRCAGNDRSGRIV